MKAEAPPGAMVGRRGNQANRPATASARGTRRGHFEGARVDRVRRGRARLLGRPRGEPRPLSRGESRTRETCSRRARAMSTSLLVIVVVVLLMGVRLADLYAGGQYVCPSCGARDEGHHSRECPWSGGLS